MDYRRLGRTDMRVSVYDRAEVFGYLDELW
jgi:hypothetical protein